MNVLIVLWSLYKSMLKNLQLNLLPLYTFSPSSFTKKYCQKYYFSLTSIPHHFPQQALLTNDNIKIRTIFGSWILKAFVYIQKWINSYALIY